MSKNKIRVPDHTPPSRPIFKLLIGALLLAGAIWGLFSLFQPPGDLVPYSKFKKTDVSVSGSEELAEDPPQKSEDLDRDESDSSEPEPIEKVALNDPDKNALDLSKVATDVTAPPTTPPTHLPRETLEHISKGMDLAEKGQFELAELEFEKAADLSPNSPEVFSIWGAALRMQKKFKGANNRFARAYELAPEDEEIVFNWGMSRLFEKNADGAIDLFKKTLKLNPKNHLAYNYLGKSYGLKKDYPNEEANYLKAVELKDDFAQGHFNLGIVRSLQKNFEGAAPHFTRAIELDKQYEKPFVVQFLTAMGLKKKGIGPQEANLKPSPKKGEEKETPKEAEDTKEKSEGSDHKMEGSDSDVVKPITNVKGKVTINSQPVDGRGVVILETKSKLKVPKQAAQSINIFQKELQFAPAHSVVMVGSKVTFTNDDREVHNIYSKSSGNQFNLGAMAAGASREIQLETPGPVILRCNLHKDMMGTVFVVPNGYFAQTNANGEYQFEDVKSQEYILEFWHPQMYPEDVEKNVKSIKLTGRDETFDFKIASASKPGEIHDLVDATDYKIVVDDIEKEIALAIKDWEAGKKYQPRKRMLIAITQHYDGKGLKGAIAKSFSEQRSLKLEQALDEIRKALSGIGDMEQITAESLKFKAERVVAQLRNNVKELEQRLNPKP
ncbi:MAG: tetratricopeptide repeat protein [Nitrospinota bacterium]|nr:tetratricopeptide repeat protein [Nitrospinota bacterium]